MKTNIKNILMSALAVLSLTTVSCEKIIFQEKPLTDVGTTFPSEDSKFYMQHGETRTIKFTAESDWSLESSAQWCQFIENGQPTASLIGEAGDNEVTVRIDAAGVQIGDPDQLAILELTDGESINVLAQIVLNAPVTKICLLNEKGEQLLGKDNQPISLADTVFTVLNTSYGSKPIYLDVNSKEYTLVTPPSYVKARLSCINSKNYELGSKLTLHLDDEKMAIDAPMEGQVLLVDKSGKNVVPLNWKYEGCADHVSITGPTVNIEWNVNPDGKSFYQKSNNVYGGSGIPVRYSGHLPFFNKTPQYDYDVIYLEETENDFKCSLQDKVEWMHYDKKKDILTVDPDTQKDHVRKGYVFCVIKHIADTLTAENWRTTFLKKNEGTGEWSLNKDNFYNVSCIVSINQEQEEIVDPSILFRLQTKDRETSFNCIPETDPAILKTLYDCEAHIENENVYQVTLDAVKARDSYYVWIKAGLSLNNASFLDTTTGKRDNTSARSWNMTGLEIIFNRDFASGESIAFLGMDTTKEPLITYAIVIKVK